MRPHKVNGTHVIINMNYLGFAFILKSAKIMTKKTKKNINEDATMYKISNNESMFAMVKTDKGIIICCGKYRVSNKTFKSYDEAETFIASKPYELIINVSVLFSKLNNNEKETKDTNESAKNA